MSEEEEKIKKEENKNEEEKEKNKKEEEEKEKDEKEEILIQKEIPIIENIEYSRCLRLIIFIILIILSIIINGDNGVFITSGNLIKNDLNLNDKEYNYFEKARNIGKIIGCIIFMKLLSINNRKILIILCLIINGLMFFVYLYTKNKYMIFISRYTISILRLYIILYIPIWIDQIGIKNLKTFMMTLLNISNPLSNKIEIFIGNYYEKENWQKNYAVEGTILLIFAFILLLFPSYYFSNKYSFIGYKENNNYNNYNNINNNNKIIKYTNERTGNSIFSNQEIIINKKIHYKGGNIFSILIKGSYIFSLYIKINLIFIFQIINMYLQDYITNCLKIKNQEKILYYYSLTYNYSPLIGSCVGGFICSLFGGYENKNSVFIINIFCTFILIFMLLLVYINNNILIFSLSLFCFYFFSYAILPIINGYIINSVNKKNKGAASCFDFLFSIFFGKIPGPFIYKSINDIFKNSHPNFAWRFSMFYYLLGYASQLLACTFRYRDLYRIEEEDKNFGKESGKEGREMEDK